MAVGPVGATATATAARGAGAAGTTTGAAGCPAWAASTGEAAVASVSAPAKATNRTRIR
ncbi:hypothetical protein [Novosphingobium rhizosphaerae]|uniref:hypothetical protein n=1 Tax=Novosphingobium rhizosphaerae TaxID=1551649 RepID=UPI003D814DA4